LAERLPFSTAHIRWLNQALRAVELFQGLTVGDIDKLLPCIGFYRFPEGHVLIREGEREEALFILYQGRVVISRRRLLRTQVPVASLLPGDFFGEMAMLNRAARSASATATEESEVFVIQSGEFRFLLERNARLAAHLRRVAAFRSFELEQKG